MQAAGEVPMQIKEYLKIEGASGINRSEVGPLCGAIIAAMFFIVLRRMMLQ